MSTAVSHRVYVEERFCDLEKMIFSFGTLDNSVDFIGEDSWKRKSFALYLDTSFVADYFFRGVIFRRHVYLDV